jgi:peroxiredoxin
MLSFFSIKANSQINKDHLKIGEKAPVIIGTDQNGKAINSLEILKSQKVMLLFYRGNWCPYCRKHLKSLQDNLDEFTKKDIYVIVVTPEVKEKTIETTDKIKAKFSIIYDIDNKIMNDYKVAFEVNESNVVKYFKFTKKKTEAYNKDGNDVLPVPATYLIDKNCKISYVQYDIDYKNRSDFKEILKTQ